jgi:hypothetical protein
MPSPFQSACISESNLFKSIANERELGYLAIRCTAKSAERCVTSERARQLITRQGTVSNVDRHCPIFSQVTTSVRDGPGLIFLK